MTQKAYTVGSAFPPLNGLPRLYSMRFCPYSQRVRLVLASKNVSYETVNINQKRKPEWYSEVNLQNIVPCFQFNGKTVYESLIICEYLDAIFPQNKLVPSDPYEKAKSQMLIDSFQRVAALLFKALKFKDAEAYNEISKILDVFEKELIGKFFGGNEPGITDYAIWPWFERFKSFKPLTNYELDKTRFPKLTTWNAEMLNLPAVKECLSNEENLAEYYKVSLTNQEPNYDIGLEPDTNEVTENIE